MQKAEKGLSQLKTSALSIAAGIGAILGGGMFLNQIADAADETIKFADSVGVAVESLGELEFATKRQGGNVEGLRSSLVNINRAIGEVERGTGRAKLAFEDYGLSVKKANGETKTADEMFLELNRKFAGLSRAKQIDLAMKMGIDKNTIRLLQTAPDEVERLRVEAAKLGVLSRQDAASAAEFNDGLTNLAQVMNTIKFELGGLVFEPLAKFFKILANGLAFFRKHKAVMLTIVGIIAGVGAAYAAMGVKAAAAWVAASLPLTAIPLAIGAIGAALVILAEDIVAFFNGQNSALGDFLKQWPMAEAAVRSFGEAMGKMLYDAIEGFKALWGWLTQVGEGIIEFVKNPIDNTIEASKKLLDFIPDFGFGGDDSEQQAAAMLPSGSTSTSMSNKISIENLNIDAQGGDSEEISRNISSELAAQLRNAVEDFDSSIMM